MNPLPILLLTLATSTLVLRSGDRIAVEGSVREENGVVTFRSGGTLYSLPAIEVDRVDHAPAAAGSVVEVRANDAPQPRRRARISDEERRRLLAELEKNHSGTAAPHVPVQPLPPPLTAEETQRSSREEWEWRREARAHDEAVRRAVEELQLLEQQADDLRSRIHSFISLGYQPRQFTYDTTMLARTLEQIPYARLEVTRAERARAQFRDDARRQGVMPGWLR